VGLSCYLDFFTLPFQFGAKVGKKNQLSKKRPSKKHVFG
jgi:hypothetical protein